MSEQENSMYQNADELYFNPVEGESGLELNLEDSIKMRLVGLIEDRYADAESAREQDEGRWLRAYHNFRGLYGKNVKFRESEKSKVFIKVTKTKVLAAFGQLVDVIFGTGQFPIGVKETRIPEGIATYQHLDMTPGLETSQPLGAESMEEEGDIDPFDIGYEGDGKTLKAGATISGGGSLFEEAW